MYKSTKTGFGFIWDFSYLLIFFAENGAEAKRQACETRQIKTIFGGEETPVCIVRERILPGVKCRVQHFLPLKLGLFGFVLGLYWVCLGLYWL